MPREEKLRPTDAELNRLEKIVEACRKLDFPDTPKRPGDWQEAHVACRDALECLVAATRDMRQLIKDLWPHYGMAGASRTGQICERVRFVVGDQSKG